MSGSLVLRRLAPPVHPRPSAHQRTGAAPARRRAGATAALLRRVASRALLPVLLLAASAGLFLADGSLGGTVGVAVSAVAAASAALCGLVGARTAPVAPATRVRTALRDRARRTAFLPQRDPDAAGRRRPRAPGRSLPTAA
ncbi:DUF6412 domain-containing protein [Streptomyces sp. NPDC057854]|uniref:DUF6412 domain-containing protein n=1 Tax=unclassified Streptomyces TaxID=2593676 RepID=UPI0036A58C7E